MLAGILFFMEKVASSAVLFFVILLSNYQVIGQTNLIRGIKKFRGLRK